MKLKEILNESSLSRLYRKYKEFDSGTISASRHYYTYKENHERTLKLKTELLKLGYSVTAIKGVYKENYGKPDQHDVHEESFIVFDYNNSKKLESDLIKLGMKYEQDAITYANASDGKYYLIGTNETGYPGLNIKMLLGKSMFGKDGEFYSKINGRPFVFESINHGVVDFDCTMYSYGMSTVMALKKLPGFVLKD